MNPILFRPKYLLLISANPKLSPRFGLHRTETGASELQISKVGFPIRKFTDQSLFAAPHDLSQRTTSFIASQRQGIHRIPLRHLIALIIDAHSDDGQQTSDDRFYLPSVVCPLSSVTPTRKTICFKCIRERCGQADVHLLVCSATMSDLAIFDRHTIGCTSSSRCRKSRQTR